ncbi:MAG: hypothetical protein JW883_03060 [Deltaproteobacteria bacterium]|nr:hypothetical protein [Deltaproteobacteria bacterium]
MTNPPSTKLRLCTCDAYPFPHRLGGGKCLGRYICPHGVRQYGHPDYDRTADHCEVCAAWEYADLCYDRGRGT